MSVKPTVMPISPNDARSAIRVYKQLEADILRLREDIKRRTCNIPAAQRAIAMKQRQLTQIQSYIRQYHIDLDQFDQREAERHRQAIRRQHAIFEDQRRSRVPGKHSLESKRARLDWSVDEIKPPALPPQINLPPVVPSEQAKLRRAAEESMRQARESVAKQRAQLEQQIEMQRRGKQLALEQKERLKSKASQRSENIRQVQNEVKNVIANEAARRQKAAEEKRDAMMKAAHEKELAKQNAQRAAEAKAKQEARIRKEKADNLARQKAVREQQAKQEAQHKRAVAEMMRSKTDVEKQYADVSQAIMMSEQALQQITNEMQHAKVGNPEVMDDLRDHRSRINDELIMLKRQAGPLSAEIQRIGKNMAQMAPTRAVDNTAGLRSWHRDVLSSGHGRRQLSQGQRTMIQKTCANLSPDQKSRVADLVARWEQGSDVDLGGEIQNIVAAQTAQKAQALGGAIALQGTARHIKRERSAVAQNNYHRLRMIQHSEDSVKQASQAATEAATNQGEALAGLFPKLRSSVTRMVGN